MVNFSIGCLECFCAVAEHQSFTLAASSLGISQSTVSKSVSKIEGQLGTIIFKRDSFSGVSLTPAGVELLKIAQTFLSKLEGVTSPSQCNDRLRLGASSLVSREIMPRLIISHLKNYGDCVCDLEVASSAQILKLLSAGEVDIGITGLRSSDQSIVQRKVIEDEFVLIASVYNKKLPDAIDKVSELYKLQFVSEQPSSGSQIELRRAMERSGLSYRLMNFRFQAGLIDSLVYVVQNSSMVAFVSKLAVKKLISDRGIRVIPTKGLRLRRHLYLSYRLTSQNRPGVRKFLDTAAKQFNDCQ